MRYSMKVTIPETVKFQTKLRFFAELDYQIFPEHRDEFPEFH